jgi:Na+/H+ antiporter NhaC
MQRFLLTVTLAILLLVVPTVHAQDAELSVPQVVLDRIGFPVSLNLAPDDTLGIEAYTVAGVNEAVGFEWNDEVNDGYGGWVAEGVTVDGTGKGQEITLYRSGESYLVETTRSVAGWWSIIPPLMAIGMALITKRVIPALFTGIWFGAMTAIGFSVSGIFYGALDTFQIYVLQQITDEGHAAVILFSCMIGGLVGIISKNGGMQGVVNIISKWASTPQKGQTSTAVLGLAIFFDDYANSLVVGNTMRSVTDRLRISREKLAYLVDSTAAPVACLALVTTWIGYEVGLIGDAIAKVEGLEGSAYAFFLGSIPFSFYPILAIAFVFMVSLTRRDFGPMLKAEMRARSTGKLVRDGANIDEAAISGEETAPKEGIPIRAVNAIVPIIVLVGGVLVGLWATGEGETIQEIINSSDSYKALMWASMISVLVAAIMTSAQRVLGLGEIVEAWYGGLKSMLFAMIILVLAWSLSAITETLHTAPYLVSILGDTLNPGLVPVVVFLLAAATAFATGSSWGTMGILLPLVIPLVWAVMTVNGMGDTSFYYILYSTISCILAGAVWGDHCSPISDTTILSSMASGCDHIDHVNTQLPYALFVGVVAIVVGIIPSGFGFPWWISMPVGLAILFVGLRMFGRVAEDELKAQGIEVS